MLIEKETGLLKRPPTGYQVIHFQDRAQVLNSASLNKIGWETERKALPRFLILFLPETIDLW